MRAWCDHCDKYVECSDEYTHSERIELKGVHFDAIQSFGRCPICGEEVQTNSMIDSNIRRVNSAYRRAIGSIAPEDIRQILTKYNIGAQPLSLLLGWGANTIERQMKHTIPDREHANRLRSLSNPKEMQRLLHEGKDRITPVAYKKAMNAVNSILFTENNTHDIDGRKLQSYLSILFNLDAAAWKNSASGRFSQRYLDRLPAFCQAYQFII